MRTFFIFFVTIFVVSLSTISLSFAAKKQPSLEIFPYAKGYSSLTPVTPTAQVQERTILVHEQESLTYKNFLVHADKALNALINGQDSLFIQLTSPNMVDYFGRHKLQKNVVSTLVPFFKNFKSFDTKMTVAPTRDAWSNEGYSFYQTFNVKNSHKQKTFVIQLVIENGSIVVANLTPDVTSPYK